MFRDFCSAQKKKKNALNCTPNRVTKVSPLELLIAKEARPFGLLTMPKVNMEKNANYDKIRFDRNKANCCSRI